MDGPARERALSGWMKAIAASGWKAASAEAAAPAAGIGPMELRATLGDRFAALAFLQDEIANAAVRAAAEGEGGVRTRLFDGFMAGFDVLQAHRPAVLAIWKARNPPIALLVGGRIGLQLRRLALAAGVEIGRVRGGTIISRVRGGARQLVLTAICWRSFRVWLADESADMAATMAALDRMLDRAGRAETEGISPDLFGLPGLSPFFGGLCGRRPAGQPPG